MIILLGSDSPQKTGILQESMEELLEGDFAILPLRVASGIEEQPLDAETTRRGAVQRAAHAVEDYGEIYHLAFGLEAGLELIDGLYHFMAVAAILRPDGNLSTGTSQLVPLPRELSECVLRGEYLSSIIRAYRDRPDLGPGELEMAEDLVNRRRFFAEAIRKAWEYAGR